MKAVTIEATDVVLWMNKTGKPMHKQLVSKKNFKTVLKTKKKYLPSHFFGKKIYDLLIKKTT